MFFILIKYMYACAHKINDLEPPMHGTHVHTRCVHNNLHEHACMSIMYTPSLLQIHVDMYMNCKPKMTV